MKNKLKFKVLVLEKASIVIHVSTGDTIEAEFSEIKRINLTIYKPPLWLFYLAILSFIAALLLFQNLNFSSLLYIPLVIFLGIFINYFASKKYLIKISLKDGSLYFKQIPFKLKKEHLVLVNKIKEEVFRSRIAN